MKISIGVFACNEESRIAGLIEDLSKQSLFELQSVDVFILANGCVDQTIENSESAAEKFKSSYFHVNVLDLPFKGKSKTWNYFVHELAFRSDFLFFIDADIRIPKFDNLEKMLALMCSDSDKAVINSVPIKDIALGTEKLGLVDRLILASSGKLADPKSVICGSLYLAKNQSIQDIYMPIGLPVEDGFLRAMLLTDFLTKPERLYLIDADENIYHIFESLRSINDLIHHQVRLVIGSAINSQIFRMLSGLENDYVVRKEVLREASTRPGWIDQTLKARLPRLPYGYVPFHFLIKRVEIFVQRKGSRTLKGALICLTGFAFDLIVYLNASYKMARGKGEGFW